MSINYQSYSVQVAFLVDITGSMSRSVGAVHSLIANILHQTIHHFPGIQPEFGFVGYRDYEDAVPFVIIPFTKANRIHEDFVSIIDSPQCTASGGGDAAEDVLGGMEKALQELHWTARVKVLIHIADAPHHGPRFCSADKINDKYPEKEDFPRPSSAILGDYADNKIDYYLFQVRSAATNHLATKTMAHIMKKEYNQCQSRTKNFTIYELDKDFEMRTFFHRVMEVVSNSVLSMLSRDKAAGFAKPICSKGKLEANSDSIALILEDVRTVPIPGSIPVAYPVAEAVKPSPTPSHSEERPDNISPMLPNLSCAMKRNDGISPISTLLDDLKKSNRTNRVFPSLGNSSPRNRTEAPSSSSSSSVSSERNRNRFSSLFPNLNEKPQK